MCSIGSNEKNNPDWMTGGPWYNTSIFFNDMKTCLDNLLEMQELTDIISCVLSMQIKNNPSEHGYGSSGGGYPLPSNSTTESLASLSATIDFIVCWLQALEQNFLERCNMYIFDVEKLLQKISVELPKPPIPKENHQSLLHAIGGGCYMNKLGQKLPPLRKRKLRKKTQKRTIK